jgi:excisionase family DNA binding protein
METALTLLKPNDLARRLAVSRAWVYEAAKSGRIPSVRIGGVDGPLRFVPKDIERWLAEARTAWLPGRAENGGDGSARVDAHAAQTARTSSSSRPPRPSGRSGQEPLF